jgi:hypothetical protein
MPPNEPDKNRSAPDPSVTLHYIDKLFARSIALSTLGKRSLLVATVLSLILLGLSGGAVSAEEKISFQGVGLKVPLAVFMTGGAVVVSVLVIVRGVSLNWVTVYRGEIMRLYEDLGFEDRTLYGSVFHAFGTPDVIGTLLSLVATEDYSYDPRRLTQGPRSVGRLGMLLSNALVSMLLIFTLPAAAVVAVGVQVSELLQQRGLEWVWIFFILLAAGSTFLAILPAYKRTLNRSLMSRIRILGSVVLAVAWMTTVILGAGIGFFVANLAVEEPTAKKQCEYGRYKGFGFETQGECIKAVNPTR